MVALSGATQGRLGRLLPPGAAVAGPVDTTAAVGLDVFRACLEEMAGDDGVDAVIVVTVPTAIADLTQALATASVAKPLVAVVLDQQPVVRLIPVADDSAGRHAGGRDRRGAGLPAGGRAVPAYAYPEGAARALGRAVAYRAWRERQRGQVPALSGLRTADARAQITEFLKGTPAGGWLPPAAVSDLLACYQIPLVPTRPAADEGGVEVLVGVCRNLCRPLVVFGLGGAATDVLGDHAAKLTPLTDTDADDLIHAVRAAPLLSGTGSRPPWTPLRWPTYCCGFHVWPTNSMKSQNSNSTRSSPHPKAPTPWAPGSASAPHSRGTRSCAGFADRTGDSVRPTGAGEPRLRRGSGGRSRCPRVR